MHSNAHERERERERRLTNVFVSVQARKSPEQCAVFCSRVLQQQSPGHTHCMACSPPRPRGCNGQKWCQQCHQMRVHGEQEKKKEKACPTTTRCTCLAVQPQQQQQKVSNVSKTMSVIKYLLLGRGMPGSLPLPPGTTMFTITQTPQNVKNHQNTTTPAKSRQSQGVAGPLLLLQRSSTMCNVFCTTVMSQGIQKLCRYNMPTI